MAGRLLNRLTARTIANLNSTGRYADGGGLYLRIDGKGVRKWVFRFQIDKRISEMGLGGPGDVSLAKAREIAARYRANVVVGINPLEAKQEAQKAARDAEALSRDSSFGTVAEALISSKQSGWRNAKHRAQWRSTLNTYAASLWDKPVAEIDTAAVLACLQPIWTAKPETAARVRGRIESVLNAARARGLIPEDRANPARWRGHLDHLLPRRHKLTRGHHAALPFREIASFMAELRQREAVTAKCLEFIVLTAARSGEARAMKWDEIDLAAKVWTVPAQRMKGGREHRVPLSPRALAVLAEMGEPKAGALVFPSSKPGRPFSDMAFKALLNRIGNGGITTHGFRSTFRDWAGEATNFPRELAEAALAHTLESKVEAAYRRGDALERRRVMMDAWAAYCEPRDSAAVVPLSLRLGKF